MNILLAMLVAFCWGTTYAVTQYTLAGWPPLLLAALRALPAGLLLFMISPNFPKRHQWMILLRLGAINIALFFSLLFLVSQTLPSAISGLGMIYVPVFAMLFHWVIHKKSSSKLQIVSAVLLILLALGLFDTQHLQLNSLGMLALLSVIICIVVGGNMTKSLTNNIHWLSVASWQLIFGGLLLAVTASIQAAFSPDAYHLALQQLSALNIAGLVWLIVPNTLFAYTLYVWLLRHMTMVEFTFASMSNPIAGILMGLLLLGESFNGYQYSIMAAMLMVSLLSPLSVYYTQQKQLKKQQPIICYYS